MSDRKNRAVRSKRCHAQGFAGAYVVWKLSVPSTVLVEFARDGPLSNPEELPRSSRQHFSAILFIDTTINCIRIRLSTTEDIMTQRQIDKRMKRFQEAFANGEITRQELDGLIEGLAKETGKGER
jgi:hypothetical protein